MAKLVSLASFCIAGALGAIGSVAVAQTAAPTTMPSGLSATLVSLSNDNATAEEAFLSIGRQAGVKFVTQPPNLWDSEEMAMPLALELKDRPFWSAVRELCTEANVQPNMHYGGHGGDGRRVTLTSPTMMGGNPDSRPWSKLPTVEVDGMLVQATAFNRQQSVNYQFPGHSQNHSSVQLTVFVDPAIRVSSFNGGARVEAAVDDNGNSLVIDEKGRNMIHYGSNSQNGLVYTVQAQLKYPEKNPGKKITNLRCTLLLRGGDKVDSLTVDKPLEAAKVSKEFGDTTVTFHGLKKIDAPEGQPAQYQLRVGLTRDDERGDDPWAVMRTAQLLDDKGVPLSFSGGGGGNNIYTVTYAARNNDDGQPTGEPVRWMIELPTGTRAIRVPVEFKDLPMP